MVCFRSLTKPLSVQRGLEGTCTDHPVQCSGPGEGEGSEKVDAFVSRGLIRFSKSYFGSPLILVGLHKIKAVIHQFSHTEFVTSISNIGDDLRQVDLHFAI